MASKRSSRSSSPALPLVFWYGLYVQPPGRTREIEVMGGMCVKIQLTHWKDPSVDDTSCVPSTRTHGTSLCSLWAISHKGSCWSCNIQFLNTFPFLAGMNRNNSVVHRGEYSVYGHQEAILPAEDKNVVYANP